MTYGLGIEFLKTEVYQAVIGIFQQPKTFSDADESKISLRGGKQATVADERRTGEVVTLSTRQRIRKQKDCPERKNATGENEQRWKTEEITRHDDGDGDGYESML